MADQNLDIDIDGAHTLFEQYAALARRAFLRALPTGEPHRYLYDPLSIYPLRPSKYLRPVLCLGTCAAFGGSVAEALPIAVALEMVHNAFLIHDDIEDESPRRRGGAALQEQYGVPLALNIGDLFAALASEHVVAALDGLPAEVSETLLREYQDTIRQTIEGQALDLGWRRDNVLDVTTADYLGMVLQKTSYYSTILPMRMGALIGSVGRADLGPLTDFAANLGAMFQIANDLEGVGDGNECGDDIREGKRTLVLIHFMSHASRSDRLRLTRLLSACQEYPSRVAAEWQDDADWLVKSLNASGSIDFGRSCLHAMAAAADASSRAALRSLPPSPARNMLLAMTTCILAS